LPPSAPSKRGDDVGILFSVTKVQNKKEFANTYKLFILKFTISFGLVCFLPFLLTIFQFHGI